MDGGSADPEDKTATRYDKLSYMQVLTEDLRVMDAAAVSLARENAIPILVFSIETPGEFQRLKTSGAVWLCASGIRLKIPTRR